jgi:hypothetical protein
LIVAVVILVTMLLWNALLPGLFKIPVITFWQAAGLLLLSRLLLGGLHGFHHHNRSHRSCIRERWGHLNPEEREEAFKNWDNLHALWHGRKMQQEPQKGD